MSEPLRTNKVLAILPFQPIEGADVRRQTEICQGIALFFRRRFSYISGLEAVIRDTVGSNPFMTPASEAGIPASFVKGELHRNQPTHLLRGRGRWDDKELELDLELLDLSAEVPPTKELFVHENSRALGYLFPLMGAIGKQVTGSDIVGRLLARVPTREVEAFRFFLQGLAAKESWRHGLSDAHRPFRYLQEAIRHDKNFHEAFVLFEELILEALEEDSEDRAAACEALASVVKLVPSELRFRAHLGLLMVEQNPEGAEEHLRFYADRVHHGELASKTLTALSKVEHARGKPAHRKKLLRSAINADADHTEAWELMGDCYIAKGCEAEAEECWRRTLVLEQDRLAIYTKLAELMLRREAPSQALAIAQSGLFFDKNNERLRDVTIDCYLKRHQLSSADTVATEWAEETPDSPASWFRLVRVRHLLEDKEAALFCLDKALPLIHSLEQRIQLDWWRLRLNEQDQWAWLEGINSAAANREDYGTLEQLARTLPDNAYLSHRLREMALALGKGKAAHGFREKLLHLGYTDPWLWIESADWFLSRKSPSRAEECLTLADAQAHGSDSELLHAVQRRRQVMQELAAQLSDQRVKDVHYLEETETPASNEVLEAASTPGFLQRLRTWLKLG